MSEDKIKDTYEYQCFKIKSLIDNIFEQFCKDIILCDIILQRFCKHTFWMGKNNTWHCCKCGKEIHIGE